MYSDNEDKAKGNLVKSYKIIATASGFLAVVATSTALTIITRLLPPLIPGGLFIQGIALLTSGFCLFVVKEPISQLVCGGIAGAILFSWVGGWWDAFYLWLAAISLGGLTGFHLFFAASLFAIGWFIDSFFNGNK